MPCLWNKIDLFQYLLSKVEKSNFNYYYYEEDCLTDFCWCDYKRIL